MFEGAAPPSLAAEPGGHSWASLPCPAEAHSRSGAGSPGSLACMPGRVLSSSVQRLKTAKAQGEQASLKIILSRVALGENKSQ